MRIGLYAPTYDELKIVAVTFSAYHSMKAKYRFEFSEGGSLVPGEPLPPTQHSKFLTTFADAFAAEAAELRLEVAGFKYEDFCVYAEGPNTSTPSLPPDPHVDA